MQRDLTLKHNGKVLGYATSMDQAEEVAEEVWNAKGGHVECLDETGETVFEFES